VTIYCWEASTVLLPPSTNLKKTGPLGQSVTAPTPSVKQALLVLGKPLILSNGEAVIALAARRRLPTLYNLGDFVRDGGLMSYSTNFNADFLRAADTSPRS
jgi:hypothetical protein